MNRGTSQDLPTYITVRYLIITIESGGEIVDPDEKIDELIGQGGLPLFYYH